MLDPINRRRGHSSHRLRFGRIDFGALLECRYPAADPYSGNADAEHDEQVATQALRAGSVRQMLVTHLDDLEEHGPGTSGRDDEHRNEKRAEEGRDQPSQPLVGFDTSREPSTEATDGKQAARRSSDRR